MGSSSSTSSASASTPGMHTWQLPAILRCRSRVPASTAVSTRPSMRARSPSASRSRRAPRRATVSARVRAVDLGRRARRRRCRPRSGCPTDGRAPARHRAAGLAAACPAGRPATRRPGGRRTCGPTATAGRRRRWPRAGRASTAPGRRRCGWPPAGAARARARRPAARSVMTPVSLLTAMTDTTAVRSSRASARWSRSTCPSGRPARCVRRRARRWRARRGARWPGRRPRPDRPPRGRRGRRGRRPRCPPRGEDDVAGLEPGDLGEDVAGVVEGAARRRGPGGGRPTGCRSARPARAASRRGLRAAPAWWRRGRGRPRNEPTDP